jgi:predicted TIM-barrel fold metal-dependent hydrolase
MLLPTRIVDTHQHVNWCGRDADGLVADLAEHHVDYAWLLTWCLGPTEEPGRHLHYFNPAHYRSGAAHPGMPLGDIVSAKAKYPKNFVIGYCPHPTWHDAPQLLEAAHTMHGARVCGEWKFRLAFDDPRCLELFKVAGRLKMPVVLHLDVPYLYDADRRLVYQPEWYGGTIDNLEGALRACPDTIFIGHAPGFWREISGDASTEPKQYPDGPIVSGGRLLRLFADYPNLWADLSAESGRVALARDPEHAVDFICRHADRLLFARDFYGGKLHTLLQSLSLPPAVLEKIYWQNAERLVSPPKA